MTPRFSAQEKKVRLLVGFVAVLLLCVAFQFMKQAPQKAVEATVTKKTASMVQEIKLNDSHFIGLRRASAQEILSALPEATGKVALVEFSSRLCHDCQRLRPVVKKTLSGFPGVHYKNIDILEDRDTAAGIINTFKPVTVPVLVFIGSDGNIKNVLYNYQSPDSVKSALTHVQMISNMPKPVNAAISIKAP